MEYVDGILQKSTRKGKVNFEKVYETINNEKMVKKTVNGITTEFNITKTQQEAKIAQEKLKAILKNDALSANELKKQTEAIKFKSKNQKKKISSTIQNKRNAETELKAKLEAEKAAAEKAEVAISNRKIATVASESTVAETTKVPTATEKAISGEATNASATDKTLTPAEKPVPNATKKATNTASTAEESAEAQILKSKNAKYIAERDAARDIVKNHMEELDKFLLDEDGRIGYVTKSRKSIGFDELVTPYEKDWEPYIMGQVQKQKLLF